jgi:hypothetical protein
MKRARITNLSEKENTRLIFLCLKGIRIEFIQGEEIVHIMRTGRSEGQDISSSDSQEY